MVRRHAPSLSNLLIDWCPVGRKFNHIFIPHGVYLISDTIYVGIGLSVVGECWSQLMAKGSSFSGLS